jgi:hypothetical protein
MIATITFKLVTSAIAIVDELDQTVRDLFLLPLLTSLVRFSTHVPSKYYFQRRLKLQRL